MRRLKYDKEKLDFVEEKPSFKSFLKKAAYFFVASIGLSLLYYVIFALFINTEEEKRMISEQRAIQQEYDALDSKVDMLETVVSDLQNRDRDLYRSIFNSDPPSGTSHYSDSLYKYHSDESYGPELIRITKGRIDSAGREMDICLNYFTAINDTLPVIDGKCKNIPSIVPVKGFSLVQTGASVGMRMHPFYKKVVMHNGIDLVLPSGSDVLASADGKVISVERSKKEKGSSIEVDHGNGYVTTYSHLGDILVRKNQTIRQGMIIGRVGSTGTSFAPHLHYEVLLEGKYMNPIDYFFAELTPSQYREMILIAANTGQSLD